MDIGLKARTEQTQHQSNYQDGNGGIGGGGHHGKKNMMSDKMKGMKIISGVLVLGIAAIVIITIVYLIVGFFSKGEFGNVNKSEYQAVFVNVTGSSGGQAYFGHITSLNNK